MLYVLSNKDAWPREHVLTIFAEVVLCLFSIYRLKHWEMQYKSEL